MRVTGTLAFSVGLAVVLACGGATAIEETSVASELQEGKPQEKKLDASLLCDPSRTDFTLDSTSSYFPLDVGHTWEYEGVEDDGELSLVITVLPITEIVAGVTTRVVEERETLDGELVEVSLNYYAATEEGTVCYFGEAVDIYEDGAVVSHEGAWRAGDPGNAPGIIMPPEPSAGVRFQMELAPGIAEDEGMIVGTGPVTVPAGTFDETIRVREFNPLDGGKGFKVFARDVGLVVDGPAELVSHSS